MWGGIVGLIIQLIAGAAGGRQFHAHHLHAGSEDLILLVVEFDLGVGLRVGDDPERHPLKPLHLDDMNIRRLVGLIAIEQSIGMRAMIARRFRMAMAFCCGCLATTRA